MTSARPHKETKRLNGLLVQNWLGHLVRPVARLREEVRLDLTGQNAPFGHYLGQQERDCWKAASLLSLRNNLIFLAALSIRVE